MTDPKSDQSPAADAEAAPIEPTEHEVVVVKPPPIPWTPERVLEWNRYYDLYIVAGVLFMVFVASANALNNPTFWSHLKTGQLIVQAAGPITTEPFSLTEYNQPKVNPTWLFDACSWLAYRAFSSIASSDPDQAVAAAKSEQWGVGGLIAIHALVRVLTAVCLILIRRKGPSLWWSGLCALAAVGMFYGPSGFQPGGIAEPASLNAETWGIFFLSIELFLLHRAINLGKQGLSYGLVPLFLVWANVDESFLIGLAILATHVVGLLAKATSENPQTRLTFKQGLILLCACFLATFVNPWIYKIYEPALDPFINLTASATTETFREEVSFFGPGMQKMIGKENVWFAQAYFLLLVAAGLGSFFVNSRRATLSRFLTFVFVAILWGVLTRTGASFALVLAATIGLNGQEWWLDTFGSEGRIGKNWTVWSVGGRSVTLILLALGLYQGLTNTTSIPGLPSFGFGFNPDDFAFEAADYLRGAAIEGNVLNTTGAQGDAIVWRATPMRKPYLDSRSHVYSRDFRIAQLQIRKALSDDDVAAWKPILDDQKISVVMIDADAAPKTYQSLSTSPNWIGFYDDGQVVMFGRSDASKADVEFFESERLDPDYLVYKKPKLVPPVTVSPTPPDWLGSLVAGRSVRPGAHTLSAGRWLRVSGMDQIGAGMPDPARCYLAIREARTALVKNANDTLAFRRLADAYRYLMVQESALLSGLELTPENAAKITQVQPQTVLLQTRYQQRVTALHYAIQTSPPPENAVDRFLLRGLRLELAQLYLTANVLDLARDLLKEVLEEPPFRSDPADFRMADEFRVQLSQERARLDEQIATVTKQQEDFALERQPGPLDLANMALQAGLVGQAITKLEEAQLAGTNPQAVNPRLLDQYCRIGQPDRALDLISGENDDPNLSTGAGTSAYRNGMVSYLIGNSQVAAFRWQRTAIPQVQSEQLGMGLTAGVSVTRGDIKAATNAFLELPNKVNNQASWEFDLGMCLLEGGQSPDLAAEHLSRCLTLVPDLALRPLIAYYLEKLDKPVPSEIRAESPPKVEPTPTEPEVKK